MKNSYMSVFIIITYGIVLCNSLYASDVMEFAGIRRVLFNRVCAGATMANKANTKSNTIPYIITQCSKKIESKDVYGIVYWHWNLKYAISLYFPYLKDGDRKHKISDFMIAFDDYKKIICDESAIASAAEDICRPSAREWVITHIDPHDFSWCKLFDTPEPEVGSGGISNLQESMVSVSLYDVNTSQTAVQKSSPKMDSNYSAPTTPIAKRVCH